jgi:hypothetical protein
MDKSFYSAAATSALLIVSTAATYATGEINVTYSGPRALTSNIADTIVFSFDSPDLLTWNTGGQTIGVFSGGDLYIEPANSVGGAGGTGYFAKGATLTLNTPASYFGLWWSAGDGSNKLNFYLSGNLVASFGTSILSSLSAEYDGNPNHGEFYQQNSGEKYAFVNFYGANGFTFDKIESIDGDYGYFESDNWTIRNPAYGSAAYSATENENILPGTYVGTLSTNSNSVTMNPSIQSAPQLAQASAEVPEASSISYAVITSLVLAGAVYRRRKSKAI